MLSARGPSLVILCTLQGGSNKMVLITDYGDVLITAYRQSRAKRFDCQLLPYGISFFFLTSLTPPSGVTLGSCIVGVTDCFPEVLWPSCSLVTMGVGGLSWHFFSSISSPRRPGRHCRGGPSTHGRREGGRGRRQRRRRIVHPHLALHQLAPPSHPTHLTHYSPPPNP